MAVVEFYFDVISPYAWLGWHALARAAPRLGVEVRCTPVLLAALLDAVGSVGPAEIPAKRAYIIRDVMRIAPSEGLSYRHPPAHPFNPLTALRLCSAVADEGARFRLAGVLLDSVWARGQDATRDETLRQALSDAGLPGETLEAARSESAKANLRASTQTALAVGVFGVPTYRVESELFWGYDRLKKLEAWLRGERSIDEPAYAAALAAPRGSDRKRAAR
jgi:2-hydroxychromene-2-carboxylate isomerase